jgi:hypothetical protein
MARTITLLTTTLFLGFGINSSATAQDRTTAPVQASPPQAVTVVPATLPVEWQRFDPKAGTWQSPVPPAFAYPRPVRYPTTGVWFYPYPHRPSGQGVIDNR